jgi:hypothetical protein
MVMSMAVTLAAARGRRFSIPDRVWSPVSPRTTTSPPSPAPPALIGAGGHPVQLGEATAEAAQRGTTDREAGLGDAAVATAQQRHRALDASGHQVAVRRLAVGQAELAAEVPARRSPGRGRGRAGYCSPLPSSWSQPPSPSAGLSPAPRPRPPRSIGRCRPQRSRFAAGADPRPPPGCPWPGIGRHAGSGRAR